MTDQNPRTYKKIPNPYIKLDYKYELELKGKQKKIQTLTWNWTMNWNTRDSKNCNTNAFKSWFSFNTPMNFYPINT